MKPLTSLFTRRAAVRVTAGALIAATLVAAGCAALKPETPEETVARRAQERWQALIKRDFPKAYTYNQPGYRAIVSADDYAKRFGNGGKWIAMDVFSTTCEPERCTVKIRLTTQTLAPGSPGKTLEVQGFSDETWIKDDGQWWFYQAY
ncbi:MAG: hypothetical protein LBH31_08655 [Burkholderiaceae bacterium]|jgi:hypothetical protein|nr:hypothetical protein [Burkholderiaceae bacterium]